MSRPNPARRVLNRPKCRLCGKPLVRHTITLWGVKGDTPLKPGDLLPGWEPMRVVELLRVSARLTGAGHETRTYWAGEFGRYGDSLFCGLTCGYRWAVPHARSKAPKVP